MIIKPRSMDTLGTLLRQEFMPEKIPTVVAAIVDAVFISFRERPMRHRTREEEVRRSKLAFGLVMTMRVELKYNVFRIRDDLPNALVCAIDNTLALQEPTHASWFGR